MEERSMGVQVQPHEGDIESPAEPSPESSADNKEEAAAGQVDDLRTTRYLTFENPEYQTEYTRFLMDETSPKLSIVVMVLTYFIYMSLSVEQFLNPSRVSLFLSTLRHIRTATLVPVLVYSYCIAQFRNPALPKIPFDILTVGNIVLLTHSLSAGLIVLARATIGDCDDYVVGCNPAAPYNSIPLDAFMFCAYSMIAIPILVKCHSWTVNCFSTISISVLVLAALAHVGANADTFISTGLFSLTILLTLYDYERHNIRLFVGVCKLRKEIEMRNAAQNEKTVISKHAQELRHLIGNVAHDLKTPVQAILLEIDFLEGMPELRSETAASINILRSTCSVMTMMINRSIDYMKSTSGLVLVPRIETVSVPECISWVLNCIGAAREGVSIRVHPIPADIQPYVLTDKQWLLENLLCLASNALKFISRGTVDIRVSLISGDEGVDREIAKPGENSEPSASFLFGARSHSISLTDVTTDNPPMLHIEVEDTGIGIDPNERNQLFRPFCQAQRHAGGTGLGLFALSKRVKSIGGSCGVDSRRDGEQGSLFWFRIPYKPDISIAFRSDSTSAELIDWSSNAPLRILRSSGSVEDEATANSSMTVLVVDDSTIIQKTTSRALQQEGFVVSCVGNGAECLEAISRRKYDVILLDINMPVMDGFETIIRIRKQDAERDTSELRQTVVGFTANSDVKTQQQAISLGMDAFIEKPLKMATLRECFRRLEETGKLFSVGLRSPSQTAAPVRPMPVSPDVQDHGVPEKSVLVVDDSLIIQKTTSKALQRDGFDVTCAGNGVECLDAMKVRKFDFILLDINMPVMDGFETISRIREQENTSGMLRSRQLVVGFSANSDAGCKQKALALGMDTFVEKPLKVSKLKECFLQLEELARQCSSEEHGFTDFKVNQVRPTSLNSDSATS